MSLPVPSPLASSGLLSIPCVLIVAFVLMPIGAVIGGKNRRCELDLLVGWAAAAALFTLAGIFTAIPFWSVGVTLVIVAAVAGVVIHRRGIGFSLQEAGRLFALALPLILVVSLLQPSQWDELSHWLPNARYLVLYHHFPTLALPLTQSSHPGYPYAMPLALYGVAEVAGLLGFGQGPVGVAPVFNALLLLVAAQILLSFFPSPSRRSWSTLALVLVGVTILTPAFVHKIVFTAYADAPTEVVILAVLRLVVDAMMAPRTTKRSTLTQLSLLLVLVALLKEDNAVPVIALAGAGALWALRFGPNGGRLVGQLLLAGVPMIALIIVWQGYAHHQIPGGGQTVRPLAEWRWDLWPIIARGFVATYLLKIAYFLPLSIMVLYGKAVWLGVLRRREDDPLAVLAWLAGLTFVGYNIFLILAYMGTFSPEEGARVVSLLRYNSHLGLLETVVLAVALSRIPRLAHHPWWHSRAARQGIPALVLIAPLLGYPLLRFDQEGYMVSSRQVGQEIAALIPTDATLTTISLDSVGYDCVMIAYQVSTASPTTFRQRPTAVLQGARDADVTAGLSATPYVWVNGWPESIARQTGLSLDPEQSHLLLHSSLGWTNLHDWAKAQEKQTWWRTLHY